jgi:hypothetical protein
MRFTAVLVLISSFASNGVAEDQPGARPPKYVKAAEAARDKKISDINARIAEMRKLSMEEKRKRAAEFQRLRDEITDLKRNIPPLYLDLQNLQVGDVGLMPFETVARRPQRLKIVEVRSETEAVFAVANITYTFETKMVERTSLDRRPLAPRAMPVGEAHETLGPEFVIRGLTPEFTNSLRDASTKGEPTVSLSDVPFEVEAENTLTAMGEPKILPKQPMN